MQQHQVIDRPQGLPSPHEIVSHLDLFVSGQGIAKKDIANAVYGHYLGQAHREASGSGGDDFGKHHILILGPTGSGKTYLVTRLARYLDVPVAICSATSLVEAGYRGQEIESVVDMLLQRAGGDTDRAERGIIYIDEIDKIRRMDVGGARDVGGEGVQHGLLTMLDGREIKGVDTSRVLFICTGAFVDLPDLVRRRLDEGKATIGFRVPGDLPADLPASERSDYEALCSVSPEDLKTYGFIPEFTGRFAKLTPVSELSVSTLEDILTHSKGSVIAKKVAYYASHGIDLRFEQGALRAIAEAAAKLKTGARALNRTVLDVLGELDGQVPELMQDGVKIITVTEDMVRTGDAPRLDRKGTAEAKGSPELIARYRQHALRPGALQELHEDPAPANQRSVEARIRMIAKSDDDKATALRFGLLLLKTATEHNYEERYGLMLEQMEEDKELFSSLKETWKLCQEPDPIALYHLHRYRELADGDDSAAIIRQQFDAMLDGVPQLLPRDLEREEEAKQRAQDSLDVLLSQTGLAKPRRGGNRRHIADEEE